MRDPPQLQLCALILSAVFYVFHVGRIRIVKVLCGSSLVPYAHVVD